MCYKVCYFKMKAAKNACFLAAFVVEMTGIEPVSEKRATLVSPGAVRLQDSPSGRPVNGPPLR